MVTESGQRNGASLVGLCLFLVAALWTARTGNSGAILSDLLASTLLAWGFALTCWSVARRIIADSARAFIVAVLAVCWLTLAGSFGHMVTQVLGPTRLDGMLIAIVWSLILTSLATALVMAEGSADWLAEGLRTAVLVLTVLTVVRVGLAVITLRAQKSQPAQWRDTRAPDRPDIYLIVLDKRSSGGWMRSTYGYDQRPFEDSLANLGFKVPASYANYAHTALSLPSLLAGRLLSEDSKATDVSSSHLASSVSESPLWAELHARGYRIAFFPTTYVATRALPAADMSFEYVGEQPREFAATLRLHSPFSFTARLRCRQGRCQSPIVTPYDIESADQLEWKLSKLPSLADSAGPIFAFLHLLSPHEPYLYNEDCSHRRPWWPISDISPSETDSLRLAYAVQTRCVDSLVLAAVTAIDRRSAQPPIVVITGDHGHGRIGIDAVRGVNVALDRLEPAQLAERLRVFTALRLPATADAVPDDLSLIEILPLVRRAAWGDSVPQRRDAPSFWSSFQRLNEFVPIPRTRLFEPVQ